jgi:hypothetical protein
VALCRALHAIYHMWEQEERARWGGWDSDIVCADRHTLIKELHNGGDGTKWDCQTGQCLLVRVMVDRDQQYWKLV